MDKINELLKDGITPEEFIEIIKAILQIVFDFVKADQGWNDEETTTTTKA